MTTAPVIGTTSALVRAALVLGLKARPNLGGVPIGYAPPRRATDVKNDVGDLEAIWLGDPVTPDTGGDELVLVRALPLEIDETYEFDLNVQVLRTRSETSDEQPTQEACDARMAELYGECISFLAHDPSLGIDPGTYLRLDCLPRSWQLFTGRLKNRPGYGSRMEARLRVNARLGFDT